MSNYYDTKALILTASDYRESDRLFSFYTEKLGRVTAIGVGVKKQQSKMAGHLQPFYLIDLTLVPGKQFYHVAQATCLVNYNEIRTDYSLLQQSGQFIRDFCRLIKESEADNPVWEIFNQYFSAVNLSLDPEKNLAIELLSILKIISLGGYFPNLWSCIHCGKKLLPENNFLDCKDNSIYCHDCRGVISGKILLTPEAIKVLRFVADSSVDPLFKIVIPNKLLQDLTAVKVKLIEYIGDKKY